MQRSPNASARDTRRRIFLRMAEADTVLAIHPSTNVSGTVRSASTAKNESFRDADIRILDTCTVGANLASMVMDAVGWAESGVSADEITNCLRAMIPRARTCFPVATLDYLQKGGRIGGAAALIRQHLVDQADSQTRSWNGTSL